MKVVFVLDLPDWHASMLNGTPKLNEEESAGLLALLGAMRGRDPDAPPIYTLPSKERRRQ